MPLSAIRLSHTSMAGAIGDQWQWRKALFKFASFLCHQNISQISSNKRLDANPRATGFSVVLYLICRSGPAQEKQNRVRGWLEKQRKSLCWHWTDAFEDLADLSCLCLKLMGNSPLDLHVKQTEVQWKCASMSSCAYWCKIGYIIFSHTLQTDRKLLLNQSHGAVDNSSPRLAQVFSLFCHLFLFFCFLLQVSNGYFNSAYTPVQHDPQHGYSQDHTDDGKNKISQY